MTLHRFHRSKTVTLSKTTDVPFQFRFPPLAQVSPYRNPFPHNRNLLLFRQSSTVPRIAAAPTRPFEAFSADAANGAAQKRSLLS